MARRYDIFTITADGGCNGGDNNERTLHELARVETEHRRGGFFARRSVHHRVPHGRRGVPCAGRRTRGDGRPANGPSAGRYRPARHHSAAATVAAVNLPGRRAARCLFPVVCVLVAERRKTTPELRRYKHNINNTEYIVNTCNLQQFHLSAFSS